MGRRRIKTTQFLGVVGRPCPKCGRKNGHLKLMQGKYYRIDHYQNNDVVLLNVNHVGSGFRGVFINSCYIGKNWYG